MVCFSETRAANADIVVQGGHRLITGRDSATHLGTGVLLHASLAGKVSRIRKQTGRITAVDVDDWNGCKCCVIAVYAPHAGHSRADLNDFYKDLYDLSNGVVVDRRLLVVGGDFNSQINQGFRSELLRKYASEHDLQITTDTHGMPWENTWTFCSSLGHTRQLDYI